VQGTARGLRRLRWALSQRGRAERGSRAGTRELVNGLVEDLFRVQRARLVDHQIGGEGSVPETLGVYFGLYVLTWLYLRPHYPVSTFWPMQFVEAGSLLAVSVLFVAGTVWLVRRRAA